MRGRRLRKTGIRAAWATLLLAGSLAAATGALAADPIKVRWGVNNPFFDANVPVNVGIAQGIFRKHGLDVEVTPTQSPMPPLLAGSVDVTSGGVPPWLSAVAQGQRPMAIATVLAKNTQVVLVKAGSALAGAKDLGWPKSLQALRGKKIGITVPGAQVDLTTRYLLLQAGLDPDKDVTILAVGGGAPQVAALEQGRVDAIMGIVPFVQVMESRKTAVALFDWTDLPAAVPPPVDQTYMIVTASKKFLASQPDAVPRIRAALAEINDWMADPANTERFKSDLAGWFGSIDPAAVDRIVEQLRRGGFRVSYGCKDFEYGVAMMKALGRLETDPACADYVVP